MRRVLVTGASGLVGSFLIESLASAGYEIIVAGRTSPERFTGVEVGYVELDLTSDAGWSSLPSNVDAVVHCGALIPQVFSNDLADRLWKVNGLGTLRLVNWAEQCGGVQFIFCSSFAVYQRPLPNPVRESHPCYPSGPAAAYALSKLAGEVFVSSRRSQGLDACSLRFSTIYGGDGQRSGVVYHFIERAKAGDVVTLTSSPDTELDLLYVRDAVKAIQLSLARPARQPYYNIGAGRGTRLAELAEACLSVFGPDRPPAIHVDAPECHPASSVLDISQAQADLGYHPDYNIWTGLQDMRSQSF